MESEGFGMSVIDDFISWLDEELSRRGWDDRQLSDRSGVSSDALARMRAGSRLDREACLGIARALNVAPERVLGKVGDQPKLKDGDIEGWMRVLEQLPPDEREELFQIAMIKLDIQQRGIGVPA
jgi:transcriptional regulator with XRE-family HTH domain